MRAKSSSLLFKSHLGDGILVGDHDTVACRLIWTLKYLGTLPKRKLERDSTFEIREDLQARNAEHQAVDCCCILV